MLLRWLPAAALLPLIGAAALADTFLVLPFADVSKKTAAVAKASNLQWVGEAVSENLREALASSGIIALDREERDEAYRQLGIKQNVVLTRASMIKLASAVDADQIVYGEFEVTPPPPGPAAVGTKGSLRVAAHLLDLKRMRQHPAFSESGAFEDLATLESRLAWRTLVAVTGGQQDGAPTEQEFLAAQPPVRLDAMENFVRGLLASSKDQRMRFLVQALQLEPNYSQAHFRLAMLHYADRQHRMAADSFAKVKPSDAHYREAVFLLGVCRFSTGDYAAAQASFEQLARDVPLAGVLNNIGVSQARRNLPEATASLERALETDPNDVAILFNLGLLWWKQSRFDKASERLKELLERDADDQEARQLLERCQRNNGPRPRERIEFQERLKSEYEEAAYLQLKSVLQSNFKP